MNFKENIDYLNDQLQQTQIWLENGQNHCPFVVTMIIKGMIETERQIEFFQNKIKKPGF